MILAQSMIICSVLLLISVQKCSANQPDPTTPPKPAERVVQTDQGIAQLPIEKLDWMLDAKFGMFIHWGVYSVPAQGEWYMENKGITPEEYAKFAYPNHGKPYFDAAKYNPEAWAKLAKDAGMKWMCLTARHHDGFGLFDYSHPNAFTSMQTLKRDLLREYVDASRKTGLKVGIYFSPINWRYPGYYDVRGTDCKPNKFGYTTDPSHKENARLMKEENYVAVKKLLTDYGKIDHIFWDGGWLAQKGSDADAAFFHEPGKFLDPGNQWQISKQYLDYDKETGKPLGIMGMVRKYQPDAITNLRYGWIGDIHEEEGGGETKGKIRTDVIYDKCVTILHGGWGINAAAVEQGKIYTKDELITFLANCVVRNMVFLLNVTPDMHGEIPEIEIKRLHELGQWLSITGESIYGTRGGPWEPVDSQYGYCYKSSTVYIHLLAAYKGDTFQLPQLGHLRAVRAYDVYTKKPLNIDDPIEPLIKGIDRQSSPADTILAVQYDQPITSVWNTSDKPTK